MNKARVLLSILLSAMSFAQRPASRAPRDSDTARSDGASAFYARTAYNTDLSKISCEAPAQARKRVLTVQEFEFGGTKNFEQAVLNTQSAVGRGMAALAVKRISEAGKFRVVERAKLGTLLGEQDFGHSTRVKSGTNARTGGVIGADAHLFGTIITFATDDKETGFGGLLQRLPGPLGKLRWKSTINRFVVVLDFRLVDTESSEVIAQGEARGEAHRESNGIDLAGILGRTGGAADIDMTSRNFLQSIIGEATIDAMDKLIAELNDNEHKIPLHFVDASSRVASIDGSRIALSSGTSSGILRCDWFTISRIDSEITDPVTKEVLDLQTHKIGYVLVTEVRDNVAIGYFQGIEAPRVSDLAVKMQTASTESKPSDTFRQVSEEPRGGWRKATDPVRSGR